MSVSLSSDGKWVVGEAGGNNKTITGAFGCNAPGNVSAVGSVIVKLSGITQFAEYTVTDPDTSESVDVTVVISEDQLWSVFDGHVASDILGFLVPSS